MTPEQAVRIVARHVLAAAADDAGSGLPTAVSWEDFPEIGEFDWERVTLDLRKLAPYPDKDKFAKAYDVLMSRAEKDTA